MILYITKSIRNYLTPSKVVIAGLLALIVLYFPTVLGLFESWFIGEGHQAHGLLLFAVCSYIFLKEWRRKKSYLTIKPGLMWLFLILPFSVLWFLAVLVHVQLVEQTAFLILASLLLLSMLGSRNASPLIFPILLLLSAVPIWSIISEPLQIPTTIFVHILLNATGYLSTREGYFLLIPEGSFEVGMTCSGLRYQIVAITIALLNAYLKRMTTFTGLLYAVTASVIAFISNSIRIYIVVLAGHYTQMQHSLLNDHIWLGWIIFSIFFFAFLLLSNRFIRAKPTTEINNNTHSERKGNNKPANDIGLVVTAILLASIGPILLLVYTNIKPNLNVVNLSLPDTLNGWKIQKNVSDDWSPQWLKGQVELKEQYTNVQHNSIDLYISYFSHQKKGEEAVSRTNRTYDNHQWIKLAEKVVNAKMSDQSNFPVNEYLIQSHSTGKKRIVWQWYYVGGQKVAKSYLAKIFNILSILQGRHDVTVIILSTEIDHSIENTVQKLNQFVIESLRTIEGKINSISSG